MNRRGRDQLPGSKKPVARHGRSPSKILLGVAASVLALAVLLPPPVRSSPTLDWSRNLAYLILDTERGLLGQEILLSSAGSIDADDNYRLLDEVFATAERRLRSKPRTDDEARETLRTIGELLEDHGFRYREYGAWHDRLLGRNLFSYGLARREIDCSMYVILYLGIAERLDLPLAGINMPEHQALRWVFEDGTHINWEATIPTACDDDFYPSWKRIAESSMSQGVYLRELGKTDIVAQALYSQSLVLNERGALQPALRVLGRALDLLPRFPDAHNLRGIILNTEGRLPRALESFNRALELDPLFSEAYFNRAGTWLSMGNREQAELDLSALEELDTDLSRQLEYMIRQAEDRP